MFRAARILGSSLLSGTKFNSNQARGISSSRPALARILTTDNIDDVSAD